MLSEQKEGELVLRELRKKPIRPGQYVGKQKNNKRHGYGIYVFPNSFFRYEGQWQDGKLHGQGKLIMKDGSYYQGSFRNDEIEGKGFRTYAFSGDNYEGNFLKGEPCGEGVMTYSNGSRYEGSWKSGKYEGHGVLACSNGATYTGHFLDHRRHGCGTQFYANGDHYRGKWRDGKRHGQGDFVGTTGIRYKGLWSNDRYHGDGSLHLPSGILFKGLFHNGAPKSNVTRLRIVGPQTIYAPVDNLINKLQVINVECISDTGETVVAETGRVLKITAGHRHRNGYQPSPSAMGKRTPAFAMSSHKPEHKELVQDFALMKSPFGFEMEPYEVKQIPTHDIVTSVNSEDSAFDDTVFDSHPVSISLSMSSPTMICNPDVPTISVGSGFTEPAKPKYHSKMSKCEVPIETFHSLEECTLAEANAFLEALKPVEVTYTEKGRACFYNLVLPSEKQRLSNQPITERSATAFQKVSKVPVTKQRLERKETTTKSNAQHKLMYDYKSKDRCQQSSPIKSKKQPILDEETVLAHKYCRPGRYVLIVSDVTEPPFLEKRPEPGYLQIVVQKPKLISNSRRKSVSK
ncbi:MORN repeat-containing protein 1-like isoform X2 [Corticium candelabrum]|uniref:MORN repeat-containing protein 1-like isoform X2 n=1 Tax=Corticium candelabrum TaxID=121492 RepID=UPI002E2639FD|nr:MORN repeat-containing protein 1-like isoform X2 [Corticium candelabrum]